MFEDVLDGLGDFLFDPKVLLGVLIFIVGVVLGALIW